MIEEGPPTDQVYCDQGHLMDSTNSNEEGSCRKCRKLETTKIWKENNKERIAAYHKTWHENNREQRLETMKIWRDSNKDQQAAYRKNWRENNKELIATYIEDWYRNNPEKRSQYEQKRRALLRGATATLTNEEREDIWEEFEGLCFWCGDVATTLDHIVPLSPIEGEIQGHHTKGNVVPSCRPCNSSKRNMDPLKFYFRIQEKMSNLERII